MIMVFCNWCLKDLEEPGGLLFTEPDKDSLVRKYHICVDCLLSILPGQTDEHLEFHLQVSLTGCPYGCSFREGLYLHKMALERFPPIEHFEDPLPFSNDVDAWEDED